MNNSNATKRISPELHAALVHLETVMQVERKKPGFENLDQVTLQVICDGRAKLYFENHRGHTIDSISYHRDGETGHPCDGRWVAEIPLYEQLKG